MQKNDRRHNAKAITRRSFLYDIMEKTLRSFQRQKGMSPSAYRRLCRENKYSLYLVNNK